MGTIVRSHVYPDGAVARPDHANKNEITLYNEINGNLDWENLKAALQNAANGLVKLDGDAKVPTSQLPESIAANVSIADAGNRYTGEEVEAALQEIAGADRSAETVKGNASNIATNVADIATNAGNIPPSDAVVKGWIQFNGEGAIAIQDSFNVSSIVDNGVGDYTINWDTDFANDDYVVIGASYRTAIVGIETEPMLVGSVNITVRVCTTGAKVDRMCYVIAIGDQ